MAVYAIGIAGILVFYVLVLGVGIWAGTKQRNNSEEEVQLAGRRFGIAFGVLTIIATWVGGGYINGAAEVVYTKGLVWCQVPIGYSLSLLVDAMWFVRPMREAKYVTMLDPFQNKYGNRIVGLFYLTYLLGDVLWVGSILNALGSSLVVILDLDMVVSVVVSAGFAAGYTVVGGLYSVVYTDALQIVCIVFGIVISAPFAYYHPSVSPERMAASDWLGHVDVSDIGVWVDIMLLLVLGGVPSQSFFQRILSIKTTAMAQMLTVISFFCCVAIAIPAIFFGVIARGTDWSQVTGYNGTVTADEGSIILPLGLRFLTPDWVSFFGLGAVSAAVMSSADACMLSSSSMFSRNIYKLALRPKASDTETLWVLRAAVVVISVLSVVVALTVNSVYYLSYLSAELVYVIFFPQLLLIVYWARGVNSYGCLASYVTGFLLRILGGEPGLGLPAVIQYPMFDEQTGTQRFPFRTVAMVSAIAAHVLVSSVARLLFERRVLPERWDVLGAFVDGDAEESSAEEVQKQQ